MARTCLGLCARKSAGVDERADGPHVGRVHPRPTYKGQLAQRGARVFSHRSLPFVVCVARLVGDVESAKTPAAQEAMAKERNSWGQQEVWYVGPTRDEARSPACDTENTACVVRMVFAKRCA